MLKRVSVTLSRTRSSVDPTSVSPTPTASSAGSTSTASPVPSSILARLQKPSKGKSVVDHINASLTAAYDPAQHLTRTFGRRHPLRAKPGSVIVVSSYNDASRTTSSSFGGVLLGVRRRGVDTAFTLRNIVNKTGVEVAFKVCSPLVKSISVVKHANGKKGGLRDLGRAKVNYLRERPGLMNQIAAAMKAPAGGAAAGKGAKPPPGKPGKPVKAA